MELQISKEIRDQGVKVGIKWVSKVFHGHYYNEKEKIDHTDLRGDDLANLTRVCGENKKLPGAAMINRRLKALAAMGKGEKINDLPAMCEELRYFVSKLPHHWLFVDNPATGQQMPYLVTSILYHPAVNRGDSYTPASVVIGMIGRIRGDHISNNRTFHRSDLFGGKTARELLASLNLWHETKELVARYDESLERYETLRKKVGVQLNAWGSAVSLSRNSWRYQAQQVDKDGVPSKVVIEDDEGWATDKPTMILPRYLIDPTAKTVKVPDVEEMSEDEADEYEDSVAQEEAESDPETIPNHPYIRVFDLVQHEYLRLHVMQTSDYMYNRRIFDQVILPESTKEIIDAMVTVGQNIGDDIIKGKGIGIVVLSTGPAGTGKTLTAEAYSERARRPLYTVQCSQLGTTPESLEAALGEALSRATKWGALMCIDEADVYIRSRGKDIQQNAVVGVFLRLLEYYRGVLFLTSNLDDIDDAIKSRCVVHVRYEYPDEAQLKESWAIYAKQYGLAVDASLAEYLARKYPISHRTVKQLCRLARVLHEHLGKPVDEHLFDFAAEFQDIEGDDQDRD